MSNFYQNW